MKAKLKNSLFELLQANAEILAQLAEKRRALKGDLLIKEGEHAYMALFLMDGITRSYVLKNGEEITVQFNFRFDFVFPLHSYDKSLTSDEYIVALTDLEYYKMDLHTFDKLKENHPELFKLESKINELYIFQIAQRLRSFQTLNAKERYLQLIKREPKIVQNCSLSHIASYLGIKLGSLSRIRKELNS